MFSVSAFTKIAHKGDRVTVFAEGQGVILHPRAATDVPQHQHAHPPLRPGVPAPQRPQREPQCPGDKHQKHRWPRQTEIRRKKRRKKRQSSELEDSAAGRRHVCLESVTVTWLDDVEGGAERHV